MAGGFRGVTGPPFNRGSNASVVLPPAGGFRGLPGIPGVAWRWFAATLGVTPPPPSPPTPNTAGAGGYAVRGRRPRRRHDDELAIALLLTSRAGG